jgi:hypothetical protein
MTTETKALLSKKIMYRFLQFIGLCTHIAFDGYALKAGKHERGFTAWKK